MSPVTGISKMPTRMPHRSLGFDNPPDSKSRKPRKRTVLSSYCPSVPLPAFHLVWHETMGEGKDTVDHNVATPFCKGMCLTAMKLTRAEGVAVFDSEELRLMWWLYLGLKSFNFLVEMVFYDLRLTGGLSFTYEWTEKSCILSKFQPGAGKDELD